VMCRIRFFNSPKCWKWTFAQT